MLLLHSSMRLGRLSLRSEVIFAVSSPVSGFVVLSVETTVRISPTVFQASSFHSSDSGELHCRKQTGEQLWRAVLQKAACRSVHPILTLKRVYIAVKGMEWDIVTSQCQVSVQNDACSQSSCNNQEHFQGLK